MTCTNRHLLCAYYFTSYAPYIYVAVSIQQGTHIIDLLIYYFWGTIVCHIFGLPGCTNSSKIKATFKALEKLNKTVLFKANKAITKALEAYYYISYNYNNSA
jgi:hypothetical protein